MFQLLVPRLCEVCGSALVEGERCVCVTCLAMAPRCSLSAEVLRTSRLPRRLPIAGVHTWLAYSNEGRVPALIRRGKYDRRPELIRTLAAALAARVGADIVAAGVEVLVPVPMHWFKRMSRGFNQAEIIADELSRATGIPTERALRAARPHSVQARRTAADRAANVAGIFALRRGANVAGRHVGLVDDILTTGATLSEAARTLTAAGATPITIITLAATRGC